MSQMNQMNFLQPYNFCMYPYRPPYYQYLYQDNPPEQSVPTTSYKSEILQWLATLDQCELYKLFSIKGQIKTFPILKMYVYDKLQVASNYALRQQMIFRLESKFDDIFIMKSKESHSRAEEFYEKIKIVDDEAFMDTIYITEPYLKNLNQFIELLEDLSERYFLSAQPKVTLEKAEDPVWFHQNSFHSCAVWIIKEFEKNITYSYSLNREKRRKNKLYQESQEKNSNAELQEFFMKKLANNKEKLSQYFDQMYQEMQQNSNLIGNSFYRSIFSGTAIRAMKSYQELFQAFYQKCHTDQNLVNQMLISSMSDLVEQRTYFLKRFYRTVRGLFQEHLENELINSETEMKNKMKKDKKKKKKRYHRIQHSKDLDPIELNRRLSSKNLLESNILRFQRSYSQNNLVYSYVTPPNTPSAWENSDNQSEMNSVKISKEFNTDIQIINNGYIIESNLPQISEVFIQELDAPFDDELINYALTIQSAIVSNSQMSLVDEISFVEDQQKEKKLRKKAKYQQKSIPESRDEQLQLKSPQSEITRFSIETQAQTIKSHCSNRTASTSEEEKKQRQNNQKNNQKNLCRIKIKRYNFEENTLTNNNEIDIQQNNNQIQGEAIQLQIDEIQNTQEISEKTVDDIISPKKRLNHSQSIESASAQRKKKKENRSEKVKEKNIEQTLQEQLEDIQVKGREKLLEQLNSDIVDFTDCILKEYDSMLPFRILTFERIKLVIQSIFYGIPDGMIKLFGSCATGMALIDSDIDIGINGFEAYNKIMLKQPFDNLFYAFTKRKWVVRSNAVFNSIVPVIKLEIDPSVTQTDPEGKINLDDQQIQKWKLLKQKLKCGIKVDISFNFNGNGYQQCHLGSATTDLVIQWMKEHPSIQQLVLILKTITKKMGLSESYTGGLSSYSLIIMVYTYLRENRVSPDQLGDQFIDFLQFYTREFQPADFGIGLASLDRFIAPNEPSYFFKVKDYCLPSLPITIFNPLNKRLLTNSCVHIGKIFDFFQSILVEIDKRKEFYCSYVTLGKKKQQKLNKTIENIITSVLETIK